MLRPLLAALICFCVSDFAAPAAHAAAPVPVTFGATWDAPGSSLQAIVDAYLGVPNAIIVQNDYVGAHAGDLDPWFWVGSSFPTVLITEVAANADHNEVGWYLETFGKPPLDGIHDGVIFAGADGSGTNKLVTFPSGTTKFGFYLRTHKTVQTPSGPQDQVFFTNRFLNDRGAFGNGATHAPFDGDVQALVFDVSPWKGPGTWLVCFEDLDSGLPITPCCMGTDNDFNDVVFQITANGATPAQAVSFGAVKARYR